MCKNLLSQLNYKDKVTALRKKDCIETIIQQLKKEHTGPLPDSKRALSQASHSMSEVSQSKKRKIWERDDQISNSNAADKLAERPKKRALPNFLAKKEQEATQKREESMRKSLEGQSGKREVPKFL